MDGKVALSELGSSRAPGTEPQDLLVLRREDWGQIPGVSWLRWGPSVWGWCNSGAACRSSSLRAGLWDAPSCPGCSRSVLLPPHALPWSVAFSTASELGLQASRFLL